MTRTRVALAAAATSLALLTGCMTATDSARPTGTADSAPPTTSASPSATVTAEPQPAQQTCDEIITPELAEQIASDGLTAREPVIADPFAQQLIAAGGTACKWVKPQTDNILEIVRLTTADGAEAEWSEELAAAGFSRTDDPVSGTYTGPIEPGTGVPPVVVVAERGLTFVITAFFADRITPIP